MHSPLLGQVAQYVFMVEKVFVFLLRTIAILNAELMRHILLSGYMVTI